jgi:hypothetical protein
MKFDCFERWPARPEVKCEVKCSGQGCGREVLVPGGCAEELDIQLGDLGWVSLAISVPNEAGRRLPDTPTTRSTQWGPTWFHLCPVHAQNVVPAGLLAEARVMPRA